MAAYNNTLSSQYDKQREKNKIIITYKYQEKIKPPADLGITSKGTMSALSKDITGIISYVNLLVSGNSSASKEGGGPLGNKFYLKTAGKCKSSDGNIHDRYMYIYNYV